MKKISNIIRNVFSSLKAGEKFINKTEESSSGPIVINQNLIAKSLANDLLNEKETQEVQNLRYSLYSISDKARDYKVLNDGTAIKKKHPKITLGRYHFNLPNKKITRSILDSINDFEESENDIYTVEIQTEYVTRFKVDKFITSIDVDINDKKNVINTKLHFSKYPDVYNEISMPFINELKKILDIPIDNTYAMSRNEIASSMSTLSFICYGIEEENDFTNYSFIKPTLISVDETDTEIILTYEWESYIRKPLNLSEKYYSKEQEEKYANKAPKKNSKELNEVLKLAKCSICGKVCSINDNLITIFDNGQAICDECIKKTHNQ